MGYSLYQHHSLKEKWTFNYARCIERNGEKQLYGKLYGIDNKEVKICGINYEIINDENIVIYNFPWLESSEKRVEFGAVNNKTFYDKKPLLGGWYYSEVVDSTVLVFKNNNIKEYLFVRGSSTIQESWEYGDYNSTSTEAYYYEQLLESGYRLTFKESSSDNCNYRINGDNLTIYWNSPRKTTTYKRITN